MLTKIEVSRQDSKKDPIIKIETGKESNEGAAQDYEY